MTGATLMTPLQLHLADWAHCDRCELSQSRHKVVQVRGSIPCDVLFCAEGPGHSEDALGRPMVGPAGKLFDSILDRCVPKGVTYAITNLIDCIPLGDDGNKTDKPPQEAIEACAPRFLQLIQIARPKLLICVGKEATEWLDVKWAKSIMKGAPDWVRKIPQESVTHPSYILQAAVAAQGMAKQRCMVLISDAIEEHVTNKRKKIGDHP